MLNFFIVLYCLNTFLSLFISKRQINFVRNAMNKKAIFLEKEKYIQAGEYAIEKENLSIVTTTYSFLIFLCWITFGLSLLDNLILIDNYIYKTIVYIELFIIINWLLTLPTELYSTFVLDKKYGFSNMTLKLFIKDTIKSGIIFILVCALLTSAISYFIYNFANWWLIAFALLFAVILLINMLYPIIREKFYDNFEKLKDKELEENINKLLKSVGFKSSGIFSVDASKRDSRLNAYFGGLGKTKRVVLFDTLIEKLSNNEILAVLGHELGHFKNKDIIKNIIISGTLLFVFLGIFGNLPETFFSNLNLKNEPYAIITVFLIFSGVFTFFLMPLISLLSRKNEFGADKFGSNLTSKEDLLNALIKLVKENKSFPYADSWYVFFYYSHPPLIERLKKLGYKEED